MAFVIKWYETIDSTNIEAVKQFNSLNDFEVIASKFQTEGRGQRGTKWESAKGENITLSIILKPDGIKAENQFIISQMVSLGILKYLKERGVKAKIKWPNDIFVGDKKIAGVLIEHLLSGDNLSGSIVGIGLNLNQVNFHHSTPNPTSLRRESNLEYNLDDEINDLLGSIYQIYQSFKGYGSDRELNRIESQYHNSLYRLDQFHQYIETPSNVVITSKITGIARNGCLTMENEDGITKEYSFKEIKYIL